MSKHWQLVKDRHLTFGSVWYDPINNTFIRRGGELVREEGEYQRYIYDLGFPVPKIIDSGEEDGGWYYIEESLGDVSLHDMAVSDVCNFGNVQEETIRYATSLSSSFLGKQLDHLKTPSSRHIEDWFEKASHFQHNIKEYPQLDSHATKQALATMFSRLSTIPMSYGHLDYGLPNMFPNGIIDWQYYSLSPVGFDVYLMLDLAAFMGGSRGYDFNNNQRQKYINGLDTIALEKGMSKLSDYRGDFLLAKSFFFIATVRKGGREQEIRKAYRRELCMRTIQQYNDNLTVSTSEFPTLAEFEADYSPEQSGK